jgi:hypothetical protein
LTRDIDWAVSAQRNDNDQVCQRLVVRWPDGMAGSGSCQFELPLDAGNQIFRHGQEQAVVGAASPRTSRVAIRGSFGSTDAALRRTADFDRAVFVAFIRGADVVSEIVAFDANNNAIASKPVSWALPVS